MKNEQNLFTLKQFIEVEKAFNLGGLRALVFSDNGLTKHGAVIRVGRRVLINREKFLIWCQKNKEDKK